MSKLVYILSLFFSLVYCEEIVHTDPNTPVEAIEECCKFIQKDVRIAFIDPLIIKYEDQPKVLIDAIDSKLAEPDIKKQLKGTGDIYHGCTKQVSDETNRKALRLFNECSDTLLEYKDQVIAAIAKDPNNIGLGVEAEIGRISEKDERAKNIANSFDECISRIYRALET